MSAHALLRIHSADGNPVLTIPVTKPVLHLGRAEAPTLTTHPSDLVIQKLDLPAIFTGVSRDHAHISWDETAGSFCLKVTGRNGCVVNKRRFLLNQTAQLPVNSVSTISLGKNCFIYFSPAKTSKTKNPPNDAGNLQEMEWNKYVIPIFEISDVSALPLTLILSSLYASNGELFDGGLEAGRKKNLKVWLRKAPFRTDPTGVVHWNRPMKMLD
jgi:hypothetical protein